MHLVDPGGHLLTLEAWDHLTACPSCRREGRIQLGLEWALRPAASGPAAETEEDDALQDELERTQERLQTKSQLLDEIQLELTQVPFTDPVTGVWNRLQVVERLAAEWNRSERWGSPLSCLLVELERLGDVRRSLGDATADGLLRVVAQRLKSVVRGFDIVGRYGGSTFVVISVNCDVEGATVLGRRIVESVRREPAKVADGSYPLAVRIGASTNRSEDVEILEDLFSVAERAMAAARSSSVDFLCAAESAATDGERSIRTSAARSETGSGGWPRSAPERADEAWGRTGFPSSPDDPRWQESWTWLYERYRPVMVRYVGYLLRGWGGRADYATDAEDVVQSYLAQCLAKGWLSHPGEKVQNFRAYLRVQLFQFTRDWLRHRVAQRRGGGRAPADVDLDHLPAKEGDPAAQVLEEGWMELAIGKALVELQRRNKREAEVIHDLVANGEGGKPSRGLGARLGLTAPQLAVVKSRAKRHFATLLADELRRAVSDDEAFREEWDLLVRHAPWLQDADFGVGELRPWTGTGPCGAMGGGSVAK